MNLKPCPFCGGEAERVVASEPQEFVLQCKGCGAASGVVVALMDEPDGHLETLWNRRAGSAPLVLPEPRLGNVEISRLYAEWARAYPNRLMVDCFLAGFRCCERLATPLSPKQESR